MWHFNLSSFKASRGFTLIELLVVMLILSISIGIVIPLTVQQVDKAKERGEREIIVSYIETLQNASYFLSLPLEVSFSGSEIKTSIEDEEKSLTSKYIFFEDMDIQLSPFGTNLDASIDASIGERRWKLVLNDEKATWVIAD